jgi:heme/copper-type cytochrome/quinol oxidase subunit 2
MSLQHCAAAARNNEEMKFLPMALAALMLMAGARLAPAQTVKDIKMTARKYEFNPSIIRVKQGDQVRLEITSLDRDHGIKLEAFGVDQLLPKHKTTIIEFTADKAGTFPFVCSHFCGLGHKHMKGELVVE